MQSAFVWRRRAEQYVKQGRYAEAADAYRREAAIRRREGDLNGAKVEEGKADRWSSEIRLFAHLPGSSPTAAPARLAKWEPPYGCYLGAFLDRDERLGERFLDENWQAHRDPAAFARLTGKKLASVFCYLSYGRPFPLRWVRWLKARGVAPHIAWEPNAGLEMVRDDDYLRRFADDAARADCPVFLRFASEMNGDWTRYGGNPLRYKQAWGTVHRVMAVRAPNVAMVWCVNHIPEPPIPLYYPGDNYVDWVGVNFYSVPFHDNNAARPGLHENPADMLRTVYRLYAAKKPIMVCEFGASHRSAVDHRDRSAWAAEKIAQLYASLPRLYPRVKLVDIFNNDNLQYAGPRRALNNYSVTDSPVVRDGYAAAVAGDYFLTDIAGAGQAADAAAVPLPPLPPPVPIVPLGDNFRAAQGMLRVSAWVRSYSPRPTVRYLLDGREVFRSSAPGAFEADLHLRGSGPHRLTAVVEDDRGRVAAKTQKRIIVRQL